MSTLMTIQALHIVFLASEPMNRWKSASSPFKSVRSGHALPIIVLIVSIVVVCCLCAKYYQSLRRRKQRITESTNTNEKMQENNELGLPTEPVANCSRIDTADLYTR